MENTAKCLVLFLFSVISIGHSQSKSQSVAVDEALKRLRLFDFEYTIDYIAAAQIEKDTKEGLLYYNAILQEFGYKKGTSKIGKPLVKNDADLVMRALDNLNLGLYTLLYEYNNESVALSLLNEALDIAVNIKKKPLICEVIKAILIYYDRILILEEFPKYYLELYSNHLYDSIEEQIFTILKADMGFFGGKFLYDREIIDLIERQLPYIQLDYYKALGNKVIGYYYFTYEDYPTAVEYHKKALNFVVKRTGGLFMALKEMILLNVIANERRMQNFHTVLELHRVNHDGHDGKTKEYLNSYRYIHLAKAYEKLNLPDSAYYYLDQNRMLRNKLNQTYHAAKVRAYHIDKETDAKDETITKLDKEKSLFQKGFYSLLPFLGLITIVAVITYFLYKRYKNRSTTLESEKSETLQKLDELKNIVIKNHLILKDKTKIYISDLMYIKSDDHYLNIYTSDEKSHFVRGKLRKIREELPPNFIQCHRSYIVNRNFVKRINSSSLVLIDKTEIPLSRSYRDEF